MDTHVPSRSQVAATPAAFGEFLRQVREQRGLTLQQIASETKIPQRHLDALEHGNLAAIPHGIYQRAEIRAYAKTVGLDPNVALAELARASQLPDAPTVDNAPAVAVAVRAIVLVIAALATGAVSGFAVWNGNPIVERHVAVQTAPGMQGAASVLAPAPQHVGFDSAPDAGALTDTLLGNARAAAMGDAAVDKTALAPVQAEGELAVTTDPAGARVTVNGVGWGVTPVTIRHLTFGEKRVRATMQGYVAEEHVVNLTTKKPSATLHILLTAQ